MLLETYSLKVSSWIDGEGQLSSFQAVTTYFVKYICVFLLSCITPCRIQWVCRELNLVANLLARSCMNFGNEVYRLADVPSSVVWQVVVCQRADHDVCNGFGSGG